MVTSQQPDFCIGPRCNRGTTDILPILKRWIEISADTIDQRRSIVKFHRHIEDFGGIGGYRVRLGPTAKGINIATASPDIDILRNWNGLLFVESNIGLYIHTKLEFFCVIYTSMSFIILDW
jgi:hypothetical protein